MSKKNTRTAADFRAAHDPEVIIPTRIRAALDAMVKEGPEHWEYEADFIRRAGVSQTQIAAYRDQFAAHIVETGHAGGRSPKRVWFGDAKVARKLRGE